MAEHDDREEASRRYREIPTEEPPPALDAAILAHARRAVTARSTRPWYFSLAAAAVLVLAVALTWNIEREQPDMVAVAPPASPTPDPRPAALPESKERAPAENATRDDGRRRKTEGAPKPAREAEVREPAPEARADRAQPRLGASARSEVMSQRAFAEPPEQWLERIAKLRAGAKHDEADKALAEFRKRYPDFRIPPEMLEKVEKAAEK